MRKHILVSIPIGLLIGALLLTLVNTIGSLGLCKVVGVYGGVL